MNIILDIMREITNKKNNPDILEPEPWSPLDSGIVAAWYDPSNDAYLVFSGSEIVGALDRSGNGLDMGITGTGTLLRGSINDIQSIAHTNENRAISREAFAAEGGYIGTHYTNDSNYILMAPGNNTSQADLIATNSNVSTTTYLGVTRSTLYTNGVQRSGVLTRDDIHGYLDGDCIFYAQTSMPGSWTAIAPYGYNNATAFSFTGEQGELIFLSAVPDTDTRQKFEGYLAHKWGMAGLLDVSHPYKNAPPVAESATIPPQTSLTLSVDLLAGYEITGTAPVTAWSSSDNQATIDIGTIANAPSRSEAGGVVLNGSSQYMVLGGTTTNFQAITETGVFAIGVRVKVNDWAAGVQCFLQTKGTGRGIFFGVNSTADQVLFRAYNSSNATLWDHEVACSSDGVEVDIIVIGDGTTSRMYVDGVLADSAAISKQAGAHQYAGHIGRNTNVAASYLDGEINALIYGASQKDLTAFRARLLTAAA